MKSNLNIGKGSLDCLVIGDAFYDIIIRIPKKGPSLVDGGTSYCNSITTSCGGSANVAVGVSLLGGASGFVGMVGKDTFGELYVEDLKRHNVQTKVFQDSRLPTGICLSFVTSDGERTFLLSRGANDCFSLKHVSEVSDIITKAKILYVSGYSLVHRPMRDAIKYAVEVATRNGIKVMFDPASYNLVRRMRDDFLSVTKNANILCLNLKEGHALTMRKDLDGMINSLRKVAEFVALKRGADGCIIATRQQIIHVGGEKVPCVDTTGAGDCFASAIAFGLTHNLSAWGIGKLGNLLASYKVKHIGARAFPSKKEIKHFLDEAEGETS